MTRETREPDELDSEEVPADDEARLTALNALHAELETELERDVDKTGPTGR